MAELLNGRQLRELLASDLGIHWSNARLSQLAARETNPLPRAAPGGPGRSALYAWDDVVAWVEDEMIRRDVAAAPAFEEGGKVFLSLACAARECQIHPDTLGRKLRAAGVQAVRASNRRDYFRLAEVLGALSHHEAEDPHELPPHMQIAYYRAEAAHDDLVESRRGLMETDTVRAFLAELVDRLEAGYDLVGERLRTVLPRELHGALVAYLEASRGDMRETHAQIREKLGGGDD